MLIAIILGFFWNVFITTKDIAKDRDTGVREIFKSLGKYLGDQNQRLVPLISRNS